MIYRGTHHFYPWWQALLGLKEGRNKATFSVHSEAATQEVTAMIYLWSRFTKIVISDIDGTITRSDLLGHILPILGRDWSHSGSSFPLPVSVSSFFTGNSLDDRDRTAVFEHL